MVGPRNPVALGPVTHARLRSALPGPTTRLLRLLRTMESPNAASLSAQMRELGSEQLDIVRVYRTSTRQVSLSARRARRMSETRRTRTIRTDYLARVEGEGAMYVKLEGDEVARRQAEDLRAAALLRGDAA